MNISLINQFTPDVLRQATELWNAKPEDARSISQVENFIFDISGATRPFILRVTHGSHRTATAIEAELQWMDDLASRGISVAAPIASRNGNFVESLHTAESEFHVAAFVKVTGLEMKRTEPSLWTTERFHQWGALTGALHHHVQHSPSVSLQNRPVWFEDDSIVNALHYLPDGHRAHEEVNRLVKWMHTLPQPMEQFGLVHADLHQGNFLVDGSTLHLFDFDDCCRHWFMYDIAVIFWSVVPRSGSPEERSAVLNNFVPAFFDGYATMNSLDPRWTTHIPEFMKYRDILLLSTVHKWWDMNTITESQRKWVDALDHDISKGIPVAEFNNWV